MTSLRFYGGVGEIGGNKILLEDQDTQIFLDFGMSFNQSGIYFSEFLQPRICNCVEDFIITGLLPDIKGVYRLDYLRYLGRPEEEREVDAVLLSHAHMDHSAYIHHLRRDIPIYCSAASKAIFQCLEDTGQASFSDYLHYKISFATRHKKRGEGVMRMKGEEATIDRPVNTFDSGRSFHVGPIEIVPYEVDHSLPGATAFLIHTSQGTVLYTGDFRFHGYKREETEEMVEAAEKEDIVACITEGTRVYDPQSQVEGVDEELLKIAASEEEVSKRASQIVEKTKSLAIVNFPARDLTRLQTFHEICKHTDRKLAITFKHAYLLELMEKIGEDYPRIDDPNIALYAQRQSWGLIGRNDYPPEIIEQDYKVWERAYLDLPNTVNHDQVRENQREYMLYCNYFQLKNLIDIQPKLGSHYIRSTCLPVFDQEQMIDFKRVENWLKLFSLPLTQIHASGHANRQQIFDTLERITPKNIYPIHTEATEAFKERFGNVIEVEKGTSYELK